VALRTKVRSASRAPVSAVPFAKPVEGDIPRAGLRQLRAMAADCRACPLWRDATQTVFGEGPVRAGVIVVGEQPGDEEDRSGRPFVGPAGRLLDQALSEAGLDRGELYLTNVVKHFKFERRGKRRMHDRANAHEQQACRIWLAAQWLRLRPRLAVALGAMAAQTLFGASFRLTRERGRWKDLDARTRALATWHPSAILRAPAPARQLRLRELVRDLRAVAAAMRELRDKSD
jgi:DNA polymerase